MSGRSTFSLINCFDFEVLRGETELCLTCMCSDLSKSDFETLIESARSSVELFMDNFDPSSACKPH